MQKLLLAYCGEFVMAFSTKKQFIAGVVCPKCSKMDKIVAYTKEGTNYRECVSCGFLDEIRISSSPKELVTRVTKGIQSNSEPTQTVKILDPSS
ncbi:MAG: YheV family putative zinc ribbon protein [Porticoccaceae bacterium]